MEQLQELGKTNKRKMGFVTLDGMKWETLSSEYIIRRPWLTARRDKVKLPDGKENPEYYVLEYPDWVSVIAITTDGLFVIERQYRHGLGQTNFEIPAGVCEKDELPIDAARRELLEETGFGGGEWTELMQISANPTSHNNLSHAFIAKGVERIGKQCLDETERLEFFLVPREELIEMLANGEMMQSLMIAPLYKALYEHKI